MANIFRQTKELIQTKRCGDLSEQETEVKNSALLGTICLLPRVEPEYDELPVSEGLEELAKIVEGEGRDE